MRIRTTMLAMFAIGFACQAMAQEPVCKDGKCSVVRKVAEAVSRIAPLSNAVDCYPVAIEQAQPVATVEPTTVYTVPKSRKRLLTRLFSRCGR